MFVGSTSVDIDEQQVFHQSKSYQVQIIAFKGWSEMLHEGM